MIEDEGGPRNEKTIGAGDREGHQHGENSSCAQSLVLGCDASRHHPSRFLQKLAWGDTVLQCYRSHDDAHIVRTTTTRLMPIR